MENGSVLIVNDDPMASKLPKAVAKSAGKGNVANEQAEDGVGAIASSAKRPSVMIVNNDPMASKLPKAVAKSVGKGNVANEQAEDGVGAKRPSVLIVDDDPMARALAKAVVKSVGRENVDIELAEDGDSAIASITKRLPELILLDLMMPRMSGFDVLKRLAAQPATRSIRVIVVSAVDYYQMVLLQSAYGVSAIVRKGEGIGPLQDAVRKGLSTNEGDVVHNDAYYAQKYRHAYFPTKQ